MVGSIIGYLGAPSGWRSKALVWSAVVFGLATIGWIAAPTASPIIQAVTPVAVAIATSNGFFMVAVITVVALMVGGRAPTPRSPVDFADIDPDEPGRLPDFAVAATTKWTPDITLRQGVGYLGAKSTWREPYSSVGNTINGTKDAIVEALASNKITAWGREHPDEGDLFEIADAFWRRADVTLDTDFAFSHVRNLGAYNVHLCQKEMEQVWPPKEEA
jgi:hypothetical protein